MKEDREIILKAYNNVWSVDRFLKHLNGTKISSPISLTNAAYFFCLAGLELLLVSIIPVLKHIPIYILLGFPIVGTLILKKVKPDGRNPAHYLSKISEHMTGRKKIIERFRQIDISEEKICFNKKIAYRRSVRG